MSVVGKMIFSRNDMSMSESEESSNDALWDDKMLIDVYDKAISVAHVEVAKRLAMNTNSSPGNATNANNKAAHKDKKKICKKNKSKNSTWKIGSECRAIYTGDGLEYEATVSYIDGEDCVVTFIGYENEEEVNLSNLKPSFGDKHRHQQILESKYDEEATDAGNDKFSECDQSDSATSNYNGYNKTGKYNTGKRVNKPAYKSGGLFLPPLPQLPSFSPNLMDMDNDMPLPPPPFLPPPSGNSPEDQALSSMLISWYMSGYYTGLYQGQKLAKRIPKK